MGPDATWTESTDLSRLAPLDASAVPRNAAGVQLLSPHLSNQIFGRSAQHSLPDPTAVDISLDHLHKHGLALKESPPLSATSFDLPPLQGRNIAEHFENIATDGVQPFLRHADAFSKVDLPPKPQNWLHDEAGWVKYHSDGSFEHVPYPDPDEGALVFDVETMYRETPFACMATAASSEHWYSWISPWLLGQSEDKEHLIPMPASGPRVVIGHNIGYDRARLLEEYDLQHPSNQHTRFLDTMSLHVACNGLSSPQRPAWIAWSKNKLAKASKAKADAGAAGESEEEGNTSAEGGQVDQVVSSALSGKEVWQDVSSMNSLAEVAKLHCGLTVNKDIRDVFGSHSPDEVRRAAQELLTYCADDVSITHQVFQKVWPNFRSACPSNVTLSGVLTMSKAFLPVDSRWDQFLQQAESTYETMRDGVTTGLAGLAEKARALMYQKDKDSGEPAWKGDVWMEQLDWTPKVARRSALPEEERGLLRALGHHQTAHQAEPRELAGQSLETGHAQSSAPTVATPSQPPLPTLQERVLADLGTPLDPVITAFLLQATWKGFPVRYNADVGFYVFAPKGSGKMVATKFQPKLSPSQVKSASDGPGNYYQVTTGRAGSKAAVQPVHDLLGASMAWATKSSGKQAAPLQLQLRGKEENLELMAAQRAKEVSNWTQSQLAEDPWLSQVVPESVGPRSKTMSSATSPRETPKSSKSAPTSASSSLSDGDLEHLPSEIQDILTASRRTWPKWYWDLDRRPSQGDTGLHLSTRTRIAPLLLRLTWKDQPIFYSKEHGWVFRIPASAHLEDFAIGDDMEALTFTDRKHDLHLIDEAASGVYLYYKLPHHDGGSANVGSPLSKGFVSAFEDGRLSAREEGAKAALEMNAKCSYWVSARERVIKQMVVWQNRSRPLHLPQPQPASSSSSQAPGHLGKTGLILPQVITMGTVTRRAVENTWLTASNAKASRVGSELKSLVRAPQGYTIVGADVDSEELWICAVMGDAYFGMHGATALGWMTLEGSKSAGTDMHSVTAKILGITRDGAKVFNYSRIYGAGVKHAVDLLKKANSDLSVDKARESAKELYARTKGKKRHQRNMFGRKFWFGGTESHVFNMLENIATSANPQTPTLGCGVTQALRKSMLPETDENKAGEAYLPSRINWVVQSSGVDYLHMLLVAVEYLIQRHHIDAKYLISVHDDLRYLVKDEDKYRFGLALQIANLWTRAMFAYSLGMDNLPQVRLTSSLPQGSLNDILPLTYTTKSFTVLRLFLGCGL